MSEQPIGRVGDYEILSVLGTGGMGRVFKARHVITDRIEAMKVLLPDLAGRQELIDRFLREIKVLAGLDHPNIAALRTAMIFENRLVMIMEYVEGQTLAERVQQGPMRPADAVNFTGQALAALGYAHRRHIIHRDIKPANMMLTPEGVVKLMDFGIAHTASDHSLTATGTTLGSLYYMSPEQISGQRVDERSDLYSVGVSLYEMVTGIRPFKEDSSYSIMNGHMTKAPQPPITLQAGLPSGLNEIILLALAKDPADRFQSADAFRAALQGLNVEPAGPKPSNLATPVVPTYSAPVPASTTSQEQARPIQASSIFPPPHAAMLELFHAGGHDVCTSAGLPDAGGTDSPSVGARDGVSAAETASDVSSPPAQAQHRGRNIAFAAMAVALILIAGTIIVVLARHKNTQAAAPAGQANSETQPAVTQAPPAPQAAANPQPTAPAANADNQGSAPAESTATQSNTAPRAEFRADRAQITLGQSATLRWSVPGSSNISIEPGFGHLKAEGEVKVSPAQTTNYVLTAETPSRKVLRNQEVRVNPEITDFDAIPCTIKSNSLWLLRWTVKGASTITIDPGIGGANLPTSGYRMVSPDAAYVLKASAPGGESKKEVSLNNSPGARMACPNR